MSHQPRMRQALLLGVFLAIFSIAPAPEKKEANPSPLAEARYQAAIKQFEEVWVFYRQSRTESFPVYYWSRLVLDAQSDLRAEPADRVAALEAHLDRMRKLETLVKKVRRIGFGFSIDVGATEYYRIEAERWLEKEKP